MSRRCFEVIAVREERIVIFTDEEEAFISLLVAIGQSRKVATVLLFFSKTPEATSHAIERVTDLGQPEVSFAMHQLIRRGWVTERESGSRNKGRPKKIYTLTIPFASVIRTIEREKMEDLNRTLLALERARTYC